MINVDLSKLKEIISSDLRLAGNIIQAIINFLSRNSFSSDFSSDINNILEKYKEVQRISSEASKSISDAISIIGGIEKGNINSIRDIVRDTNSNRPTKTNTRSSNKADNIEYLGDTTSEPEEKSSVDVKKENPTNDVKVENVSKTTKEVDKTTNIETVKPTDTSSSNQVSKTEETTKAVETNDLVTVADNILKVDSVDNSKTGANETKELSDENSSFMDRIINWLKKAWSELRYKFKSKTKETQQIRSEFTKEINNVSDRNSQVYENSVNNAFFQNMPKFESTLKDLGIEDWQLIDDDTRSKYEKYEKDLLDLLNEFNNLGGNFALASDNIDEETRAKLNKLQNKIQTLSEERNKFINDTIEEVMKEIDSRGNELNSEIKKLKEQYEQLLNEQNDANNDDTMPLVKMLENKVNNQDDKRFAEMQSLSAKISDLEKKRDAYVTFKAEYMGQLKQINFSSKSATYSLSALEGFNYTEAEISEYMENVYKNSGSKLSYETWKAFNQEACVEQFLIEKGNEWRIEKYGSLDYLSDKQKLFMEPDEIAMYNYLHKVVSVDAADDYLSFLEDELNRREGEANALEFLNSLKNNNVDYVRTAGEGVKNGLQNFLSGYYNLVFADSVVDVDDYENMYIIEALSSDDYKVGLDFTYSTASSIGNMLIPATLSTVVTALTKNNKIGGIVGNVAMSASILGNTFDQSLEEGKSLDGAFKYAVFSTASESVTSLFLSGVGFSVIEQKFGLFGNVVNEITEEELQLFLDKGYKALVEGDTEAFNNIKEEMGDTFAQTLVSTLVLNGYNKATSTVASAAMGGIASVKGKRASGIQPNSKIVDKVGANNAPQKSKVVEKTGTNNAPQKSKVVEKTGTNNAKSQRIKEIEAIRLKEGETLYVNKYSLEELVTIRKNNPGVNFDEVISLKKNELISSLKSMDASTLEKLITYVYNSDNLKLIIGNADETTLVNAISKLDSANMGIVTSNLDVEQLNKILSNKSIDSVTYHNIVNNLEIEQLILSGKYVRGLKETVDVKLRRSDASKKVSTAYLLNLIQSESIFNAFAYDFKNNMNTLFQGLSKNEIANGLKQIDDMMKSNGYYFKLNRVQERMQSIKKFYLSPRAVGLNDWAETVMINNFRKMFSSLASESDLSDLKGTFIFLEPEEFAKSTANPRWMAFNNGRESVMSLAYSDKIIKSTISHESLHQLSARRAYTDPSTGITYIRAGLRVIICDSNGRSISNTGINETVTELLNELAMGKAYPTKEFCGYTPAVRRLKQILNMNIEGLDIETIKCAYINNDISLISNPIDKITVPNFFANKLGPAFDEAIGGNLSNLDKIVSGLKVITS